MRFTDHLFQAVLREFVALYECKRMPDAERADDLVELIPVHYDTAVMCGRQLLDDFINRQVKIDALDLVAWDHYVVHGYCTDFQQVEQNRGMFFRKYIR